MRMSLAVDSLGRGVEAQLSKFCRLSWRSDGGFEQATGVGEKKRKSWHDEFAHKFGLAQEKVSLQVIYRLK